MEPSANSEPSLVVAPPTDFRGLQVRHARLVRVTSRHERYASWPQGKLYFCDAGLRLIYNAGTTHSSQDLAVYERTSADGGLSWSDRRLVAPSDPAFSRGVTAWAAGQDESGVEYVILRCRGANFSPRHPEAAPEGTEHRLLLRRPGETAWRSAAISWPYGGDVPVLYHGFLAHPSSGFDAFWHLPDLSAVGGLRFSHGQMSHARFDLDPQPMGLCEATAVRTREGGVLGFFRVQNPDATPPLWRSDDAYQGLQLCAGPPGAPYLGPIAIGLLADGRVLAASCSRHGQVVLRLHLAPASPMYAAHSDWAELDLVRMASLHAGASGTGVPALALRGGRLVVAFGHQPPGTGSCSIHVVSMDVA